MSPHAVNNFVSDLVQMAQAMEELPKVQAELSATHTAVTQWITNYNEVKGDLEQSKSYAATLEQRVHDLEVARDDAELSFLEADERTSRALDFVKALFGNAGALIQALEPPKAAAPQADSPSLSEPIGVSVPTDPTANHATPQSGAGSQVADASIGGNASVALDSHPVGERESPLSDVGSHGNDGATPQAVSEPVSAPQSTEEPATLGPYHGKNYDDLDIQAMSEAEWIAGGGTHWNYWHKREDKA